MNQLPGHPIFPRRDFLHVGALGVMGLSAADVAQARANESSRSASRSSPRSAVFLFLTGGLAQHESFDMKPEATPGIRGEFTPISTATPGIDICEHLPLLAERSRHWALLRSLSHSNNNHDDSNHLIMAGRSNLPPGFKPKPYESADNWPTINSLVNYAVQGRGHLPSSILLPMYMERSGQLAGQLGSQYDPYVLGARAKCLGFGACPDCFDHESDKDAKHRHTAFPVFESLNLNLPESLTLGRIDRRRELLSLVDRRQRTIDAAGSVQSFDRFQQSALALLTSPSTRAAFDLDREPPETLDAYGRNLFGWSLLLTRRLVEAGVNMVQVNLGRESTWDTHGNAFPSLKNRLFPPLDRAVSAFLDDLRERGLLDQTFVVMAGEFGRTPHISGGGTAAYPLPGRDHWGAVQTAMFFGGGVRGGQVIGSSDARGAYPRANPKTPEELAATIYHVLDIPQTAQWLDPARRPHAIYHADPIRELFS
jgi:hypothetical protein